MTWIWILLTLTLLAAAYLLTRPLRISRDPDREGIQDDDASVAYDRVSRWPVFTFGRYLVLRPLAGFQPQGLLLDVGCGPGHLTAAISRKFRGLNTIGLDISPKMASIARNNWPRPAYDNLDFIIGDIKALPMPDDSADIIVSSLSLHHWVEPEKAIAEMHRVLKPGGRLLIFDLRRDSPRSIYYVFAVGQALFTPEAIRRTNGAVGSFWASYTAAELKAMLSATPFEKTAVRARPGWLLGEAMK
ncbi:MAG: hypothetical protein A2147_11045 [Chloroflexi bacterium RBG_16_57_8]|nr:MAG: hypothetical protein A2147_11045 [Chloroflexi bacterium RBG_16_57_8]